MKYLHMVIFYSNNIGYDIEAVQFANIEGKSIPREDLFVSGIFMGNGRTG